MYCIVVFVDSGTSGKFCKFCGCGWHCLSCVSIVLPRLRGLGVHVLLLLLRFLVASAKNNANVLAIIFEGYTFFLFPSALVCSLFLEK